MDSMRRIFSALCVLVLVISVFAGLSFSEGMENSEKTTILVKNEDPSDFDELLDENEILERYDAYSLVRTDERKVKELSEAGLETQQLPERKKLSIRGYEFDIEDGYPDLPEELTVDEYENGDRGVYVVHMVGPIKADWRSNLESKGVEVINYVPNYAYEVRMTPGLAEDVRALEFVDWVGVYQPAFKLADGLEPGLVNIRLVEGASREAITDISSRRDIDIISINEVATYGTKILAEVRDEDSFTEIALNPYVYHISNHLEPKLHAEVDSQIIGGGAWVMDDDDDPETPYRVHGDYGSYINQMGYDGSGIVIAVPDTGLGDGTTPNAGHPDFTDRVIGGHGFENEDEWQDGYGHGTHCAGSAVGDTFDGTGEEYAGHGPYYVAQGMGSGSDIYGVKIFSDDGSWIGPSDYLEILEVPKQNADAYVSSNSWGSDSSGSYGDADSAYDIGVRDSDRDTSGNQPTVVTVSAGNAGSGEQTTGSPGNGKNVITVGAVDSYMPDADQYGNEQSTGDNPDEVADFSSRGWTADNRVKPDIVAPGASILSTSTPEVADSNLYGLYSEDDRYEWCDGTSMSNPTAAGAALVATDWYESNYGERPSPAMVKALMINTAHDLDDSNGNTDPIPNKDEGWGLVDLSKLEYPEDDPISFYLEDQTSVFTDSQQEDEYPIVADRADGALNVSVVWTDKEAPAGTGDDTTLLNDLDLEVESPSGDIYRGNAFENGWTQPNSDTMGDFDDSGDGWDDTNTVENVYIPGSEVEDGVYTVRVRAQNIAEDAVGIGENSQDYALAIHNALEEVPGEAPQIDLTRPTGGEVWQADTQEEITWDTQEGDDPIDYINLYYSVDGGDIFDDIATNLNDTGSYTWDVPNEDSDLCRVRAQAVDESGRTNESTSDNFTIEGVPPEPPQDLVVEHYSQSVETLFEDDVEEGDKGYTTDTSHTEASKWDIRQHGSTSGNNSWDWGDGEFNKTEDYGMLSSLISPEITIPADADPEKGVNLTFQHWRDFGDDSLFDAGNMKISTNGADGDFELIVPEEGYDGEVPTDWGNPLGGEEAWGGQDIGWETATFDLTDYIGETVHLNWTAGTEAWSGYEGQGWRIDDIYMEATVTDSTGDDDNLVTWDASPDDPSEVSHYSIYRSENETGPWDETTHVTNITADGSGNYTYLDKDKGELDDIYWWYVVRAVGENGLEEQNDNSVQEPGAQPGPVAPTDPDPADGATDVSTDVELSAYVEHDEGDPMDVSFYDASDDSLIDTDNNVSSGDRAQVMWSNLNYDTVYEWYVIAEDADGVTAQSDTWSFTTMSQQGPVSPTDPDPADGATDVSTDVELSAYVEHDEGDPMDVSFYDASDDSLIDTDNNVSSGDRAQVMWSNLNYDTVYEWYVIAEDADGVTAQSDTWSFTTMSEDQVGAYELMGYYHESYDGEANFYDGQYYGNISVIELENPANIAINDGINGSGSWQDPYGSFAWDAEGGEGGWSESLPALGNNIYYINEIPENEVAGDASYVWTSTREVDGDHVVNPQESMMGQSEPLPTPMESSVGSDWIDIEVESPAYTDWDDDAEVSPGMGTYDEFVSYSVFVKGGTYGGWTHLGNTQSIPEDEYDGTYDDPIEPWNETTDPDTVTTGMNKFNATGLEPGTEYEFEVRMNVGEGLSGGHGGGHDNAYTTWGSGAPALFQTETTEPFFEVDIVGYDEEVTQGEEVGVNYTVTNTGGVEDTQTIEFLVEGALEDSVEVTLAPGEEYEDQFTWLTEDPGEFLLEVSSEDDTEGVTVTVLEEGIFSVSIADYDSEVIVGDQLGVNYTVMNTGDTEATQTIEFTVDGTVKDSEEVTLLGGETYEGTFTWQTEAGDEGEHTLRVSSEDDHDEVSVTVLEEGIFAVSITEYDSEVVVGEQAAVNYSVTNTAEETNTQTIEFTVDGELTDSTEITLNADETYEDVFTWQTEAGDEGEHTLMVASEDESDEVDVMVMEPAYFEVNIVEYDSPVLEGEEVVVNYTVTNTGDVSDTQLVEFSVDGSVEDSIEITLDAGEDYNDEFAWLTEEGDAGEHVVRVASEDQDSEVSVMVLEEAYFDVEIIDYDDIVVEGEEVVVNYTVTNTGDVEDTQTIEFTVDGELTDSLQITLGPEETSEEQFTWQTQDPGEYDLEISSYDDLDEVTVTVLEEGVFDVTILDHDERVVEGDEVSVQYRITNTKTEEDTQTIEFSVNGTVEDSVEVTLEPGEEYEDQFTWQSVDPGEFELKVASEDDDDIETVTVLEEGILTVWIDDHDEEVVEGDEMTLNYTVWNTGDAELSQEIEFIIDSELQDSEEVTLAGGEQYESEFTWQTEEGDAGEHALMVASEDSEEEATVTVLEPAFFEIDITEYDEEVTEGEDVVINYSVTNTGDIEDIQTVEFTVDGGSEEDLELTLAPGEEHDDEFIWTAGDPGEYIVGVRSEDDEEEVTVTVIEEVIEYTLTISAGEGGTTDPEPGNYSYEEGENVTVTAKPGENWSFSHWEGDFPEGEETSEEITITLDSDKEVTAHFEEDEEPVVEYELTVESTEGGEVIEPGEDTFEYEENVNVNIEAVAEDGYEFVEWTGDVDEIDDTTASETTITILDDYTITAEFEEEEEPGEPYFEVTITSPEDGEEFEKGEEVIVEYEVENTGDAEGTQDLEFLVDGELIETEEDVTLAPGDTEEGSFVWEADEDGEIELVIRSINDEEVVESTAEISVTVEDEGGSGSIIESETCSWWWLLLILLIIIVVIVIILVTKRGEEEEEPVEEVPPPISEETEETEEGLEDESEEETADEEAEESEFVEESESGSLENDEYEEESGSDEEYQKEYTAEDLEEEMEEEEL
ncbi:MAG: CARDB domain-containing protein [Candidatus Aenigmatarchaeota archaeon]